MPNLTTSKSTLRFVPDKLRIDNQWGGYSAVHAELTLLEFANSFGPYSYYHLLSGVDLPIKSNAYIHAFFEKNKGKNFIGFGKENDETRMRYYHFFVPKTRKCSLKKYVPMTMHHILLWFQKIFHITRNNDIDIRKGEVWVSITEEFAKYCICKKEEVYRRIKHTCIVDELLWQTLVWSSPLRSTIYNLKDEWEGCMREIDWERGRPYVWGQDHQDLNILMNSDKLFARKFSSLYPEIIDEVFRKINNLNCNIKEKNI